MAHYDASELSQKLAGVEPVETLAGTQGAHVIAMICAKQGIETASPAAPGAAPQQPRPNEWKQVLG